MIIKVPMNLHQVKDELKSAGNTLIGPEQPRFSISKFLYINNKALFQLKENDSRNLILNAGYFPKDSKASHYMSYAIKNGNIDFVENYYEPLVVLMKLSRKWGKISVSYKHFEYVLYDLDAIRHVAMREYSESPIEIHQNKSFEICRMGMYGNKKISKDLENKIDNRIFGAMEELERRVS